jgi:hypothetical protein
MVFTFTLFYSTAVAKPTVVQQSTDLVTLTVSSSCASVNVRLSTGEILKTPFNKLLPRGQEITIEALESQVLACAAAQVVTDFRRFIINQVGLPKRQLTAQFILERDTSVYLNYGFNDPVTVTLSGLTTCGRSAFRLLESEPLSQEGQLTTHFDLTLYQQQRIKLEAFPQLACGDTASVLGFHQWVVGGKSYPEGQLVVEFSVEKYTTAVPIYDSFVVPRTPLTAFQLLRNGKAADFIRAGDKLKKYTVILNADNFPPATKVFANGIEAAIINASPNQLEVNLPGKKAQQSGIISVIAIAPLTPVNQFFAPAPIEVRKE